MTLTTEQREASEIAENIIHNNGITKDQAGHALDIVNGHVKTLARAYLALSAAKPQGRGSSSWNFDREADAVNEITTTQPSPDRMTEDERRQWTALCHEVLGTTSTDQSRSYWCTRATKLAAMLVTYVDGSRLTTPQAPILSTDQKPDIPYFTTGRFIDPDPSPMG